MPRTVSNRNCASPLLRIRRSQSSLSPFSPPSRVHIHSALSYIHTFHFRLFTGVTISPRVLLSNLGVFLHWLLGFPELDLHSFFFYFPPYRVQRSETALPFFRSTREISHTVLRLPYQHFTQGPLHSDNPLGDRPSQGTIESTIHTELSIVPSRG